ncbi:MAG: hypothetical protein ABI430_03435 [Candidatus Taylorbacteria bacterium]
MPESSDLLAVTMIPSVPAPGDFVTVDLQSYQNDLNKATISWTLNKGAPQTARGLKHFEFSVGGVGSVTTLLIRIQTYEGETISRNISIRPGNIDLLWEASTYAPPLYPGKTLYTPQSDVKIVAMPNLVDERGVKIDSKDLIFEWKLNGKLLQDSSGFGKDVIFVTGPSVIKTMVIDVVASSLSGNTKAKGNLSLNETSPFVLFYENNPLLGTFYEKALPSEFTLAGKEITLTAVPFFFSTLKRDSNIFYSWTLNGNVVPEETRSAITLRKDTQEAGESAIGLEVKSVGKIFQFSRNSLLMKFGETVAPSATF